MSEQPNTALLKAATDVAAILQAVVQLSDRIPQSAGAIDAQGALLKLQASIQKNKPRINQVVSVLGELVDGAKGLPAPNYKMMVAAPQLYSTLKAMSDFWRYSLDKPDGAEPTEEDHATAEKLAGMAAEALHAVEA